MPQHTKNFKKPRQMPINANKRYLKDLMPCKVILGKAALQSRLRREIQTKLFNNKYPCRKCHSRKNIQIHHLYEYSNKEEIVEYEDFKQIPWIPLCLRCHMELHSYILPKMTEDD